LGFIYGTSNHQKKVWVKDKKQLEKVNHMPSEAFESNAFDPSMADVWSLGLLLCQMITKQNPFKVNNHLKINGVYSLYLMSSQTTANNYWIVHSFVAPIKSEKFEDPVIYNSPVNKPL
jgi:hypothetical protein